MPERARPILGAAVLAGDSLLNVRDVARRLRTTTGTVYGYVRLRRLSHYRLTVGLRFDEKDVDAFLDARRVEASKRDPYAGTTR